MGEPETGQRHRYRWQTVQDPGKSLAVSLARTLKDNKIQSGPYFWIDAICINQENLHERNHQVSLMKSIYFSAQSVVVWLGPSEDSIVSAFNTVKSVYTPSGKDERVYPSRQVSLHLTSDTAVAILYLCRLQYWSRVWIIQEVVLGQSLRFYCGKYTLNGEALEQFFQRLSPRLARKRTDDGPEFLRTSAFCIMRQRRDWHNKSRGAIKTMSPHYDDRPVDSKKLGIPALLATYKDMQSTDPRDKVYALLSLASEEQLEAYKLHVDYSKTPHDIYSHLLQMYIRQATPTRERLETFARLLYCVFGWKTDMTSDTALRQVLLQVEDQEKRWQSEFLHWPDGAESDA
ncbi:heterokaryon incompatibility protein-domain-containing protein [Clohesyomyces aquaticus]|uniref:Heterokaryon incompatibility protein-domain-containing protein n=1 Tax=Clohesyomyces aquaticus TaxID=1231657 RepID=A0A1Y2A341_9PLEO|nr:heterokaryon incompatibility protein-domain-containing protein [Clohesyomyces aquaticus]